MQVFQIVVAVLILGLLSLLIVFCNRKILPRCCPCFNKVITLIKGKIMFNSLLRALLQTFLLTCILMWNAFRGIEFNSSQGWIDFCTAILLLGFSFSFPILAYRLLRGKFKENTLRDPSTKIKYDSIYANLDYYKPHALFNTSFFLFRRLALACLIVFGHSIVLQVLIADCLSTLLLAFYLRVRPMTDLLGNIVHIINESVVLVCTWLIFQFTLFVPDAQQRYDQAWYFLHLALYNIIFNVLIFIYLITKRLYLALKNWITKRRRNK